MFLKQIFDREPKLEGKYASFKDIKEKKKKLNLTILVPMLPGRKAQWLGNHVANGNDLLRRLPLYKDKLKF